METRAILVEAVGQRVEIRQDQNRPSGDIDRLADDVVDPGLDLKTRRAVLQHQKRSGLNQMDRIDVVGHRCSPTKSNMIKPVANRKPET